MHPSKLGNYYLIVYSYWDRHSPRTAATVYTSSSSNSRTFQRGRVFDRCCLSMIVRDDLLSCSFGSLSRNFDGRNRRIGIVFHRGLGRAPAQKTKEYCHSTHSEWDSSHIVDSWPLLSIDDGQATKGCQETADSVAASKYYYNGQSI